MGSYAIKQVFDQKQGLAIFKVKAIKYNLK